MITVSNVLFDLSRSLSNGSPETDDVEINIPSQINAFTELIGPTDGPLATSSVAPQQGGFAQSTGISVVAGVGAANTVLATLKKGLWLIDCEMSIGTNYQVAGTAAGLFLNYGNGSLNLLSLTSGGAAAAPVLLYATRKVRVLIPRENATISIITFANGAGQSLTGIASLYGTPLL